MEIRLRPTFRLRIGASTLTAEHDPFIGMPSRLERSIGDEAMLGAEIGLLLDSALPSRRFANPKVIITFCNSYARSGVMYFPSLPKLVRDRELVIGQRFCRENRLDQANTAVSFAVYDKPDGSHAILIETIPQKLRNAVISIVSESDLHCDIIRSDLSAAITSLKDVQNVGLIVVQSESGITLLLRGRRGVPESVVFIATPEGISITDISERLAVRIRRYANLTGRDIEAFETSLFRATPRLPSIAERLKQSLPGPVRERALGDLAGTAEFAA